MDFLAPLALDPEEEEFRVRINFRNGQGQRFAENHGFLVRFHRGSRKLRRREHGQPQGLAPGTPDLVDHDLGQDGVVALSIDNSQGIA